MAMHFLNLYNHDFVRVAAAVPLCRVADPQHNAEQTAALLRELAAQSVAVAVFPELGLSGYSCEDLFQQQALQQASLDALAQVLQASRELSTLAVVGLPLRVQQRLFNVAVVLQRGRVLGVVPKSYLPNYGEFYEPRQFAAADHALVDEVELLGQRVLFGSQLVFEAQDQPLLSLHVELCEDVWAPIPPSSFAALAGATVLLNLSASNALVGKAAYRRQLVAQQSARCLAAYVYSAAGAGESSTDAAWDGHALIGENGALLAQSERFADEPAWISADIDLQRLAHERARLSSYGEAVRIHAAQLRQFRRVSFQALPQGLDQALPLHRALDRHPYVPADDASRDERCEEVFHIQVQALVQRLRSSGLQKLVVGVSGGLDSTHALLVAAQAMDKLKLPRSHILAYTMPGFATSERTRDQAWRLMQCLGCSAEEIDIKPSCTQMLQDLRHPFAQGQAQYDVTFENVQAGQRTSHLFRLANHHGAMVLGTGDLSELALGWCTYGVGDHMSHYNVNASVPKTLIRYLVRWVAETGRAGAAARAVLEDILNTEISPELVPASAADPQAALQSTEAAVGPYELQDFNLYQALRWGYAPRRIAFLAWHAWGPGSAVQEGTYSHAQLKSVLGIFVRRFYQGSQFKRSCVPNAPKVGSGGSLSPRGDWRAPSDASARTWLDDWAQIPDHLP
ncbi:NAD(+) synthase [Roseateles sp. BYS180W]|uniref:Glutamine-dependent NAD(+) synthetase n=1 Tax=Roseateles rivi TaxID=3299028 RepID=A0ABW7FVY5_9BURK